MQRAEGFEAARRKTEAYLKRDLGILVRIADVPDILYLNEDLFVQPTCMRKMRDVLTFSCIRGTFDRFAEYEEFWR